MTTFERFDVVEVPFPFSDLPRAKRRKALVVSTPDFQERNEAMVLMMITSAARSSWHLDVALRHLRPAGLRKACVARLKIFTLDAGLVIRRCGRLHEADARSVEASMRTGLGLSAGGS